MRDSRLFVTGIITVASLAGVLGLSAPSSAQTPTRTPTQVAGIGECNTLTNPFAPELGPFAHNLANPKSRLPETIADDVKSRIIGSGLPCQDSFRPSGPEDSGLEDLQHGFDFFSWLSFIAWNSPADPTAAIDKSQADMPTRWEDMDNFKQLLDVMLDPKLGPPKWPADKSEMEEEKVRLLPAACRALYKPGMMVVKMIEESYNEPFKTGPLIDQQGHYAIFDILMNRTMFDYMSAHNLFTRAGQQSAENFELAVDFPPGQNPAAAKPDATPPQPAVVGDIGAVMLKVSWKILAPDEISAKNFHMVNALVSMPKMEGSKADPPCLPKTLGLIGFHLVHKTVSRPQWIWTSFEHVRNVPDKDEVAANKFGQERYNFFAATCKGACPKVNATPPRPWTPDPALQLRFRKDDSAKSQIVREIPLTQAARNMNRLFHIMLKDTVWVNYMLLSTQWPSDFSNCTRLKVDFQRQPDMTCSPAPTFFANSTLETYSQGTVPLASSSCIGCHGNAVSFQKDPNAEANPAAGQLRTNQSDFTFMLEKAP